MSGLLEAILAVQGEVPTLRKDATNPHFKSTYTPLDTIVETVGPILHKHGLIWSTFPSWCENVGPTLRYELAHAKTGEAKDGEMPLLLSKNDAQGQGSAITYARRYALCAVLNLVADDDDDGNQAADGRARSGQQNGRPASPAQVKYVKTLLKQKKATVLDIRAMLKGAGVTVTPDADPAPLVDALTGPQASEMIEFLKDGKPVPTGESDVPADGAEFVHEPAGETPMELHG